MDDGLGQSGSTVVACISAVGWVGAALDRMDATSRTALGQSLGLKGRPSSYFKRQCWVSGDPNYSHQFETSGGVIFKF